MLDGMSGLWCCNLGYSQTRGSSTRYTNQLQRTALLQQFFPMLQPAGCGAGRALVEVTPPQFNHVFFTNSGSEANDTNLRLIAPLLRPAGQAGEKTHYQSQECLSRLHHRGGVARWHERDAQTDPTVWTTSTISTSRTGLKRAATRAPDRFRHTGGAGTGDEN